MSVAELKRHAHEQRLTPRDLVRKGEDGDWLPAAQIKGLFGEVAAGPPRSAPPPPRPMPGRERAAPDGPRRRAPGREMDDEYGDAALGNSVALMACIGGAAHRQPCVISSVPGAVATTVPGGRRAWRDRPTGPRTAF
jgi:hypothetical protein